MDFLNRNLFKKAKDFFCSKKPIVMAIIKRLSKRSCKAYRCFVEYIRVVYKHKIKPAYKHLFKNKNLYIKRLNLFLNKHKKTLTICCTVIFFLMSLVYTSFLNSLKPVIKQNDAENVVFHIKSGMTAEEIAGKLKTQGLIKNSKSFLLFVRLKNYDKNIKAGKYLVSRNMSVKEMLEKFVLGKTINDSIKVTIPEGFTLKQIADLLEQKGLVEHDVFIETAVVNGFDYDFLEGLSPGTSLEGYLFPDTYNFPLNADEKTIINIMLKRFDEVFNEKFRNRARVLQKTYHEIITLASIIEKEGRLDEERPIIASVFYNRLERGMPLQSCATVQYALGDWKETLLYKDLEVDSPYNTYKHLGLPPGPISNPGKASIYAALYPADTDFLYFVAKGDGSHRFSKTFNQHLKAIRTIKQE